MPCEKYTLGIINQEKIPHYNLNRKIIIKEREVKRVQEMLANLNKDEKTLVFCANQAHAALIRDLINAE